MSLLSKFFETRHKDNSQQQTNQNIASLFSVPPQSFNPSTVSNGKKKVKTKNVEEQQQMEDQVQEEQQIKISKKKKKQKNSKNSSKKQQFDEKNEITIKESKNEKETKKKKKQNMNQNKNAQDLQEKNENQKKQQPEDLESTIFVGNIPLESTHKSIKKFFQKYGKVIKVWFRSIPVEQSKIPRKGLHILKKYQEGADSMNAYVKFEKKQQAETACSANGQQIDEKNIKVTLCNNFEIDCQTSIFIGNLPKKVKDQQLWQAFKPIGNIKSVRVIRNKSTMEGIGIGYVRFETKELMQKAIKQMNGKKIGDRPMRIKKAVSKQRLQKKIRKTKERKENKAKGGNNKFGKGSQSKIRNQTSNNQRPHDRLPQKSKKINKDFQLKNNKDGRKYPNKDQPSIKNHQPTESNEIIRTKYGFKGTRISFQ